MKTSLFSLVAALAFGCATQVPSTQPINEPSQEQQEPVQSFNQTTSIDALDSVVTKAKQKESNPKPNVNWHRSFSSGVTQAVLTDRPAYISYVKKNCSQCDQYLELMNSEDVSTFLNTMFVPILMDVDELEAQELVGAKNVNNVPLTDVALFLVDDEGELSVVPVARVAGVPNKELALDALKRLKQLSDDKRNGELQ